MNYLAQDRPDLAMASCVAAARMSAPRKGDEALLKRIARYLIHTREARTLFQWQDANVDQITVITDSDWATCPATRRSRSGGAVFWGTHCVQHWCKAQDRIARSSGEADIKACCKAISEALPSSSLNGVFPWR